MSGTRPGPKSAGRGVRRDRQGTEPGSSSGSAARRDARLGPDATLVKVAISFVLVYAVLQTSLWALSYAGVLGPVIEATTGVAGACTSLTGTTATVSGNRIVLPDRILQIDLDCTGLSLVTVYAALILAYPLSLKRKLVGLAVGIPVLLLANIVRLVAVARLSGPLGDDAFMFVHDYLFKVAMIAVVIALWGVYLSRARRDAR